MIRAGVRARLAIVAAVGGLALAGTPEALADPIPLAPDDGATFTARVDQLAFQASTAASPSPGRIDFYISQVNATGPDGVLSSPIDSFFAGPNADVPPVYEAGPDSDAGWPNKPGKYYWQAVYHNCAFADPNCFSPIRSLTIDPLPAPTQTSPDEDATIPYGGRGDLLGPGRSLLHARRHADLHRVLQEHRPGPRRDVRRSILLVQPSSVGEGVYEYKLRPPISNDQGPTTGWSSASTASPSPTAT